MNKDPHRYDDMLSLPHHQSAVRPHMPLTGRAAQFSPFAALTGYENEIREAARLTEEKIELSDTEKEALDEKLRVLQEQTVTRTSAGKPTVSVTYFCPDKIKTGGSYITTSGIVKKFDLYKRKLVFYAGNGVSDGESIDIDDILILDIGGR